MTSSRRPRRRHVEPTDDWEQLRLLARWPEQAEYELIRPIVLFGSSAAGRAKETGAASERTLQRRASRFEAEGMESLFGSRPARYRKLPPSIRRLIVDLKAEYAGFNLSEISAVCYVRFGRWPDRKTVRRVLSEEPIPLRMMRRFSPYHEIAEPKERRKATVTLHAEGWSAKAIAGTCRSAGLPEPPHLRQDPSPKPPPLRTAQAEGPAKEKREMPFAAVRRHQFWTADIRYIDDHRLEGRAYVVSVLDKYSRCILSSALTRTQDLASYLSVLYAAVERYGSPEALVTDGGGVFRARQARAVYEALGIAKHEIERGRPWQSYIETTFNIQRRMADWHFSQAKSWLEFLGAHDRFVEEYNAQPHWAHRERPDSRAGRLRRSWAS